MQEIIKQISNIGILPVLKIDDPTDTFPLISALYKGGIECAEITFRTPHAVQAIKDATTNFPNLLIGAGTVLTVKQAQEAKNAGAKFIVTPGFNVNIVEWCLHNEILIIPGISTASEIEKALEFGLSTVKFFPAESSGGSKKIKDLSAPYSTIKFIPTGGINQNNMHEYLSLPCVAAIGGSFMLPQQFIHEKNWDSICKLTTDSIRSMLNYHLIHVGINNKTDDDARKNAQLLCSLFGFDFFEKPKSYFSGVGFELLNSSNPNDFGHIGIYTPYPERALYHLKQKGIKAITDTITRNKATNLINFAYLDLEISGFKFHLINPDIKM